MDSMRLSEAAELIHARHSGEDVIFSSVSTDTRTIHQGDLFVALSGEHFDGHDYIEQAGSQGAVAVMLSKPGEGSLPALQVEDTRLGLGRLAAVWRSRYRLPVVAVTGSNGKTTVKEMVASILGRQGEVLATRGNLNNEIGLPLTLLQMRERHHFAVVEMGASHAGEIRYLTRLASPHVALITNAAPAHLEGFGSVEGVAKAKGEIFEGLDEGGVAIINADDPHADYWRASAAPHRVVTFGMQQSADVSAQWSVEEGVSHLQLQTPQGSMEVRLHLLGRHNCMNALAAAAVAVALEVGLEHVARGLATLQPVKGRMQLLAGLPGMQIINDTYNANPASLQAALQTLQEMPGTKWLVLGDMAELGADAVRLHAEAGRQARAAGVQRLFALGPNSASAAESFGGYGFHFTDSEQLVGAVCAEWQGSGVVLVKGSRSMRMERVVEALCRGCKDGHAAHDGGLQC